MWAISSNIQFSCGGTKGLTANSYQLYIAEVTRGTNQLKPDTLKIIILINYYTNCA
jgi:hypothetical protein